MALTLCTLIYTLCLLLCFLSLVAPAGGSYKKIGYYDSSQKNLSWFGNDVWIGKMGGSRRRPSLFTLHRTLREMSPRR